MRKYLKYLSFGTMAVLIVAMMAATILEKLNGTSFAFRWVYHNPFFIILWAVAAITGMCYLLSRGIGKRFFTLLLHISFVVILAGALVTFLFGKSGEMHLRVGETSAQWTTDDGTPQELPFALTLDKFVIDYYTGSRMPSDYSSTVQVEGETHFISLNHILKYGGYRFFQADFDEDRQGSVFAVSHDPWGTGITYLGYLLLLVSMLGFFTERSSRFRSALRRVAGTAAALLLFTMPSFAQSPGKALPRDVADAFGDLYVYYNDRIAPFQTQARDYCMKVYGKAHVEEYSAEQAVTGWLFYYDDWKDVPHKVKKKDRGTARESEKVFLVNSVAAGDGLRFFPVADQDGSGVSWYDCNEPLPDYVLEDYGQWAFVRNVLDLVEESVRTEDWEEVKRIVGKIKTYQETTAATVLPSVSRIRAERIYNRISRPMIPFMTCITLGILLFILTGIWLSRGYQAPLWLRKSLAMLAGLLLAYLTMMLGLRWFVSGHAPFAGSYSMMLIIAWLSSLAMLLLYKKFPLMTPLGFLLSGFTLLMASMASANPQVTHLMPVLQSPLLSIHVLSMMISYTLFGMLALNGVMGLIVPMEASKKLQDVSLVLLYPAVFLLTFGTFLGAVWANISWGTYWAWDPKETWALITLLVYAMALHGGALAIFRKPRFFHGFCLAAFLCVLITYFGVNLILGGMHSYA